MKKTRVGGLLVAFVAALLGASLSLASPASALSLSTVTLTTEGARVLGSVERSDFEEYCRDRDRDFESNGDTAYGGSCEGDGIDVSAICRDKFSGDDDVTDRLTDYNRPAEDAFECIQGRDVGTLSERDFEDYCSSGDVERGETAGDWGCDGDKLDVNDLDEVCEEAHSGRGPVLARVMNWFDPNSIRCYGGER